jgi:uncharacterized hydrophobic protein (TIGR00271 family)
MPTDGTKPTVRRYARLSQRLTVTVQNRLAAQIGCAPESRMDVVAAMLQRDPTEATAYWLQLVVAVGIATLGLVLGSTAVVIGAMLIAPLMGPIVSLGMGLATGSPFLVLRSGARALISVGVATLSSALLTRMLPFHELNAEISARTVPTALDLLTAAFCAVAGVYASMRASSDVATTAAGTSIGISLVPPLCACGFGLGLGEWSIAGGAALLFLANFVAIVVVGTIAFIGVGFNQVDIASLEARALDSGQGAPLSRALAVRLAKVFASPGGSWLRLSMPLVLLAAVYVPLNRALDEVAWQIRARSHVMEAIDSFSRQTLHSHVRVERGTVEVLLVLLGSGDDATRARTSLEGEIRRSVGVAPRLEVMAVPDATAFAGLESELQSRHLVPATVTEPMPPAKIITDAQQTLRTAFDGRWPNRSAGRLLALDVDALASDLEVSATHLGPALDASGIETLERAERGPRTTRGVAHAVDPRRQARSALRSRSVHRRCRTVDGKLTRFPQLSVCVEEPASQALPSGRSAREAAQRAHASWEQLLAELPRVVRRTADKYSLRVMDDECPKPAEPGETD